MDLNCLGWDTFVASCEYDIATLRIPYMKINLLSREEALFHVGSCFTFHLHIRTCPLLPPKWNNLCEAKSTRGPVAPDPDR